MWLPMVSKHRLGLVYSQELIYTKINLTNRMQSLSEANSMCKKGPRACRGFLFRRHCQPQG